MDVTPNSVKCLYQVVLMEENADKINPSVIKNIRMPPIILKTVVTSELLVATYLNWPNKLSLTNDGLAL